MNKFENLVEFIKARKQELSDLADNAMIQAQTEKPGSMGKQMLMKTFHNANQKAIELNNILGFVERMGVDNG